MYKLKLHYFYNYYFFVYFACFTKYSKYNFNFMINIHRLYSDLKIINFKGAKTLPFLLNIHI